MMRYSPAFLTLALLTVTGVRAQEQEYVELHNAEVIHMDFLGLTPAYRDWDASQEFPDPIVRTERGLLIPHEELENKGLHQKLNPKARPYGADPVWQQDFGQKSSRNRALDLTQDGIGYTSVNPADPCLDVGPNHVVQMINGGSGSYFQVFDKNGSSLGAAVYLDNFVGSVGGAGDPIVLYDAIADRWLMSEFAASGNRLLVAISQTPDPTGSWYAYSFTTPNFPDYPKYSVWNSMYMVTSNEGTGCPIYALDRTKMLAGDPSATTQRFTTPDYPTIGFQATTPITFDGGSAPPAGAPAMLMRMADDAWSASIPNDRLELWTLTVDFTTPGNSVLSGPTTYATQPFDTELCGYTSFSCIDQPGTSVNLDPLREVIMNRAHYRNLGTHEVIVCNHVTDVDGTDHAGIRWYELRRTGGPGQPWSIHQQGTYAPDGDSRWMAGIAINDLGDIALAYSVSSGSTAPSLRYTGRNASDPLGQMTVTETSIAAGTSGNASNRWGDYFSLDTDPSTGSFWGTGCYNTTSSWRTRIFEFSLPVTSPDYTLAVTSNTATACQPTAASYTIQVGSLLGYSAPVTLSVTGLPAGLTAAFSSNPVTPGGSSTLTIGNTGSVAMGSYGFTLQASSTSGPKSLPLTLEVTATPGATTLLAPANGATGVSGALSWNAAANADSYSVTIATDAGLLNVVESATGVIGTSYTPTTATAPLTTYFWRVQAANACGNGAASPTWSFTTGDCVPLVIKIVLDRYGSETTWTLEDDNNAVVASGGPYTDEATNGEYPQPDVNVCVPEGCYSLIVNDSFGDGNCCAYGNGVISVEVAGTEVAAVSGDININNPVSAAFCVPRCTSTYPFSDDLENGTQNWTQDATDDFDWTLNSGGTPSGSTGPAGDHTTGTGSYLYTEASNPNFPSRTAAFSRCFDLSAANGATLGFWYHMFGAFMGTLHVDVFDGSTWNNSVWSRSGDQGDVWQQATVDLTPYLAADLEVRFRGVTGSDPTNGWQGDMAVDDINITVSSGIRASVQVFLEGPYNAGAGSMNDDLRTAGLVPTVEPYSGIGYTHVGGGGETTTPGVLAVTGNNAVVDWVVLELRATGDPSTVVASRSALLQRDGDVVDTDGTSAVLFQVPAGSYHVAVRHRNHLGCMTAGAVALSASSTTIDLRSAATSTFGTQARKTVGSVQALWAGDVRFNADIKYTGSDNDRDPILQRIGGVVPTNVVSGYHPEDVDLDGNVKYTGSDNDRDPILQNIGGVVPTATRQEQLP